MPSANDVRGSQPSIRFAFDESPKYEPMSIASRSGGHGTCSTRPDPAARTTASAIARSDRCSSLPTLKISPAASGASRREQQALDDVVDVEAVALLLALAEHRDRLVGERAPHEDRQEPLEVVAQALAGPEHVREAHRAGTQPVDLVVQQVQLLGRVLGDAVDVDRGDGMLLVDRQVARLAEDLPGRRVHDRGVDVLAAQQLEEPELARRVHLEVEQRVVHRVDVTHLPGEVEHDVGRECGVADVRRDRRRRVGVDDGDPGVGDPVVVTVGHEVRRVRTVARHERVDHRHLGATLRPAPARGWSR